MGRPTFSFWLVPIAVREVVAAPICRPGLRRTFPRRARRLRHNIIPLSGLGLSPNRQLSRPRLAELLVAIAAKVLTVAMRAGRQAAAEGLTSL